MSTYDEAWPDVHGLMKVGERARHEAGEAHVGGTLRESWHLPQGTEVAPLRRRLSLVLQQALSFRTRHHLCRQRVTHAGSQQLRLQGLMPVQPLCTEGRIRSKRREGANGDGDGDGDGDGNEGSGGNGDGDWNESGDRRERGREREKSSGIRHILIEA